MNRVPPVTIEPAPGKQRGARHLMLLACLLALGCQSPPRDRGAPPVIDSGVEAAPTVGGDIQNGDAPDDREDRLLDTTAFESQSQPAVVALLDAASQSRDNGELARAAQHLERALRIDPNDALAWHRLAEIKFTQADYQQTLALCARSNALLDTTSQLRRANHILRARAYDALGDHEGAVRERSLAAP